MMLFGGSYDIRIKSNSSLLVKLAASAWALAQILLISPTFATTTTADLTLPEKLPDIEAKTYDVKVVRRSHSTRVYLIESPQDSVPETGRIMLLRKGPENVMAFRVLKNYPEKGQFAAKRVRRYGVYQNLENDQSFMAIEKIADVVPPPLTANDQADIRELEKEFQAAAAPPPLPIPTTPPTPTTPEISATPEAAPAPTPTPEVLAAIEPEPKTETQSEPPPPALPKPEVAAEKAETTPPPVTEETSSTTPPPIEEETSPPPSDIATNDVAEESTTPPPLEVADANAMEPKVSEKTRSYDQELDAGSSPPPLGSVDQTETVQKDEDDEEDPSVDRQFGIAIDDLPQGDPYAHWLTAGMGFLRNNGSSGGSGYFSGGGVRYGTTVSKNLLIRKSHTHDSLSIEGGMFLYKVLNYAQQNDAFTVVPMIATLRYNIMPNETFTLFIYGGIGKNFVVSAANSTEVALANLGSFMPAGGVGTFFRVGPNWDARLDLGLDIVGLGLVLRF